MISGFDPGALLARSYVLPRGPRVCLRLARVRDLDGIRSLLERQRIAPDELEVARLVRCDPRRLLAICATALIGTTETVVGIGALELADGHDRAPTLLVVDDVVTDGLAELLCDALAGRAQALGRAARTGRRAA